MAPSNSSVTPSPTTTMTSSGLSSSPVLSSSASSSFTSVFIAGASSVDPSSGFSYPTTHSNSNNVGPSGPWSSSAFKYGVLVLFVLVLLSSFLCSCALRRRTVVRNGFMLPGELAGRGPRPVLGKRPRMWDAYVDAHGKVVAAEMAGMAPLAGMPIGGAPSPAKTALATATSPASASAEPPSMLSRLRLRPRPTPPPAPSPPSLSAPPMAAAPPRELQLAVLISLPGAGGPLPASKAAALDDVDLSERLGAPLVLGVARVPLPASLSAAGGDEEKDAAS